MNALVVDASIVVKWFLPEAHAAAARRVLTGGRELVAPDLLWAEVGNVLWKKVSRQELTRDTARGILHDVQRFPLQTYDAKTLLDAAWDLANRLKLTVYDGLYLALAVNRDCTLVTADHHLYTAIKSGSLASTVTWVESFS